MKFSGTLILLLAPHLAWSMWNKLTGSKLKPPQLKDGTFSCADGYKISFAHVKEVVKFALPKSPLITKFIYGPYKYRTDSSDEGVHNDFGASNSDYEWPIEWTTANWAHNLDLADYHFVVFDDNGKIKKVYYYDTYHSGVEKSRKVNCWPIPEIINVRIIYGPIRVTAKSPDSRIPSPKPHNAGNFSPGPSRAGSPLHYKLVKRITSRSNSFRLLRDN